MRWRRPFWLILGLTPWCANAVQPEYAEIAAKFASTPQLKFAALDLQKLDAEDAIADKLAGQPMRFAVAQQAARTPDNSGQWSRAKDGSWVWRLAVEAKDAAHLNFGFTRFNLPLGAELLIVDAEGDMALGPYTAKDRLPHGQLWTPILYGERAVIELRVPAAERDRVDLELGRVNQGYRGFGVKSPTCKSGACNTDVACLASSDPWNEPRRAVGAYTRGGVDTCTGSLLNNTRNDGRMLFATASHCNIRDDNAAASVVVYWNYESPTCRTPGSPDSGTALPKPSSTTQGLRFLAATDSIANGAPGNVNTRSDWTLLELATPPAGNNFNLFWAGWDRSAPPMTCSAPSSASSTTGLCASIHHPNVDEKRITFVESNLTRTNYYSNAVNLHWDARWDPTPPVLANISPVPSSLPPSVTEPGSSGSPLYNAERRMVGVLSGGPSACGATGEDLRDFYGGLFHAWEGNGTPTTRVRDYLDPTNSGVTRIDGFPRTSSGFTVQLNSTAFSSGASAGGDVTVSAAATGGSGSLTYEWDTDGDGVYERSGSASSMTVRYPRALNPATIAVRVRDSSGTMATSSRTFEVRGPLLSAAATGQPSEVCGNGDGVLDPGERWQLPVRISNAGSGGLGSGNALFAAASSGSLELGPNQFGYRGSRQAASCGFNFIDIASGSNATTSLALTQSDDGRAADAISLGGRGILLYGQRYTQAVMSTNGYISFAKVGRRYSHSVRYLSQ